MYDKIIEMLKDMSDAQLKNVLDYVTDEYDEENHEEHILKVLIRQAETKTMRKIKLALAESSEATEDRVKWVEGVLKGMEA